MSRAPLLGISGNPIDLDRLAGSSDWMNMDSITALEIPGHQIRLVGLLAQIDARVRCRVNDSKLDNFAAS